MAVNSFVPLETRTGTFAGDFLRAHEGKDIVIWGAGFLGRCLIRQLKGFAAPRQHFYFTDSNPKLHGTIIDGNRVLNFQQTLQRLREGIGYLVVAVAGHSIKSVLTRLTDEGFKKAETFDSYLKLSRPEAVIQVSARRGGILENMALDSYQAIIAKLKADIPDILHIDLSGWGEPLDNPQLMDIISSTRTIAPCTVTTKLMAEVSIIENVLLSAPSQFVVSVDGYEISYQENTPDGNWETLLSRLNYLSSIQDQLFGKTEIRIKYNLYNNNCGDDFSKMALLCEKLGIRLVKSIGYIDPYDIILKLCQSGTIGNGESRLIKKLAWPFWDAIRLAQLDQGNPCLCQRIFPIIHTNGSVGICHLYHKPRIHQHYLDIDYDSLQRFRLGAEHCRLCQQYALHRLDIDVLQSRYATKLLYPLEIGHA